MADLYSRSWIEYKPKCILLTEETKMITPAEGDFRVSYDKNGKITSVEKFSNGKYEEVPVKTDNVIEKPILNTTNTTIILCQGDDPCIVQGDRLYCW